MNQRNSNTYNTQAKKTICNKQEKSKKRKDTTHEVNGKHNARKIKEKKERNPQGKR